MQPLVFISGGDAFSNHEDFLDHLRKAELWDPLGKGSELWTSRLREDLKDAFVLYQLSMPNKQNADYTEWSIWFERHFSFWQDGVVLVGWSLGGMFLARYLSEHQLPFKVKALYLLAAPCGSYHDEAEPGNDCGTFQFDPAILGGIRLNTKNIEIWHSKDDFVVSYEQALKFTTALPEAKLVTFTDRNHFLQPDFPELFASLKGQI